MVQLIYMIWINVKKYQEKNEKIKQKELHKQNLARESGMFNLEMNLKLLKQHDASS